MPWQACCWEQYIEGEFKEVEVNVLFEKKAGYADQAVDHLAAHCQALLKAPSRMPHDQKHMLSSIAQLCKVQKVLLWREQPDPAMSSYIVAAETALREGHMLNSNSLMDRKLLQSLISAVQDGLMHALDCVQSCLQVQGLPELLLQQGLIPCVADALHNSLAPQTGLGDGRLDIERQELDEATRRAISRAFSIKVTLLCIL